MVPLMVRPPTVAVPRNLNLLTCRWRPNLRLRKEDRRFRLMRVRCTRVIRPVSKLRARCVRPNRLISRRNRVVPALLRRNIKIRVLTRVFPPLRVPTTLVVSLTKNTPTQEPLRVDRRKSPSVKLNPHTTLDKRFLIRTTRPLELAIGTPTGPVPGPLRDLPLRLTTTTLPLTTGWSLRQLLTPDLFITEETRLSPVCRLLPEEGPSRAVRIRVRVEVRPREVEFENRPNCEQTLIPLQLYVLPGIFPVLS